MHRRLKWDSELDARMLSLILRRMIRCRTGSQYAQTPKTYDRVIPTIVEKAHAAGLSPLKLAANVFERLDADFCMRAFSMPYPPPGVMYSRKSLNRARAAEEAAAAAVVVTRDRPNESLLIRRVRYAESSWRRLFPGTDGPCCAGAHRAFDDDPSWCSTVEIFCSVCDRAAEWMALAAAADYDAATSAEVTLKEAAPRLSCRYDAAYEVFTADIGTFKRALAVVRA